MPAGRPRSLSCLKRNELCSLVADGLPLRDAARHVGCHIRTIRRAEEEDPGFRWALKEAELSARMEPEKLIRQAAATHWRAAVWLLERDKRRSPARSPRSAALPADLQLLGDILIEAVLNQLPDPHLRRVAYEDLTRIAAAAARDILTLGGKTLKRRTKTPATDAVLLDQQLDAISVRGTGEQSLPVCLPLINADRAPRGAEAGATDDKIPPARLADIAAKSRKNQPQRPLAASSSP